MNPQLNDILSHYEIEHYIQQLQVFDIQDYGSKKWYAQNQIIQKLNIQSHINALVKTDQYIMEHCVTFDKLKLLVYDLLMTEIWKQQLLPKLKSHMLQLTSLRSYFAIQHESVLCNLLEVILYHRTAVEACDNYLLEVIDYCYRKVSALLKMYLMLKHKNLLRPPKKKIEKLSTSDILNRTTEQEFEEQIQTINLQTQMMSLSILRYITDYIQYLPVGIVHHLIVENDFFFILVPLIEEKPWIRTNSQDKREVFENSKWNVVEKGQYSKLPGLEAQVWITLYNLFMNPESRRKYELTDFKKNNLLRLRKYMNELLLDQIPNLIDMLRALEELSLMNVSSQMNSNPFIVQQMPELRSQITNNRNWEALAEYQKLNNFILNDEIKEEMKQFADLYGTSVFEGLIEGFHCEKCSKDATKRCSRCKQVWYCSKECQVDHWKIHKIECAQVQQREILKAQKQGQTESLVNEAKPDIPKNEEKITEVSKVDFNELD